MVARLKLLVFSLLFIIAAALILSALVFHALIGSPMRDIAIARSFDRSINILIGGDEKETISSHVGRMQRDGDRAGRILAPIINFFFGIDHCKNAIGV